MSRQTDPEILFAALRTGDRVALAQAITLVESTRQEDSALAEALVERCLPHVGMGLRLGITGIPGVGKSTLIDALGKHLIDKGHRVAVLAVDPSSPSSNGSILGDKTRMERLSTNEAAFIRPSPTAGVLGGVARSTRGTIVLCEAAGYDRILVETVGVGQSELEVDHMTDLNLLLMLAGAGDELQGIKRGIMESADLIALTKAEGENLPRAETARRDLRNAVMYLPMRGGDRHPEVLLTSAVNDTGIVELADHVEALFAADKTSGKLAQRRSEQSLYWLHQALREGLLERLRTDDRINAALPGLEQAVKAGERSPFKAAQELLACFLAR